MAAPITHVAIADRIYHHFFTAADQAAYIVGTSFPDIRRLAKIQREKVHFTDFSLEDIAASSLFSAGLKIHSVVDIISQKFYRETELFSLFPSSRFVKEAAELFADQVLYAKINTWKIIAGYFNRIYSEELTFGVSKEAVVTWHQNLARYFMGDINQEAGLKKLILGNGNSEETVNEMINVSKQVKDKARAESLVLDFYSNFENLVNKS
jgi:hypothetical protein